MALLDLWKASPDELQQKAVRQLIGIAANGKLADGNETSAEFRSLLAAVPSKLLATYAEQCLVDAFPDSGLALQDIINEIGRRLGFQVFNGLYRGKSGAIGNDGLWALPSKHKIVVEVKTTDAYRIDLDTIARYRKDLVTTNEISEENSSVLIVVGRTDTGDLEAQIRGSRHAWSMRLVSVESLTRLMFVKEFVEDPDTLSRIHQILIPHEFTKLDEIVDLVFSTTEDAKQAEEPVPDTDELQEPASPKPGSKFTPVDFNELCADRVAKFLSLSLVKRSRAMYSSPEDTVRVLCAASRKHQEGKNPNYWFAFHPHQKDALEQRSQGYAAFGCGSPALIFLIPIKTFAGWLDGMNMTVKPDRSYWHVQIYEEANKPVLVRKRGQPRVDLTPYRLPTN